MPFGILEDYKMECVPGTSYMTDEKELPADLSGLPREVLKHGTGKQSHIILVPQPTDDPNDPLNWPLWQKDLILVQVGLIAAVTGAFGPMLSPGFVQISKELGITVNTLSQSTSWLTLTIGLSLFITNPLAKKYGKRPIYIASVIIMFVGSVWGGASKDYSSFLGSRVWSGFGMAPFEVLCQCTIGDMYFIHQRGTRIAAWSMFLLCGIAGGGLVSGYIIQDDGWKWTFWICAIFYGCFVFCVLLFIPETSFDRSPPAALIPKISNPEKNDGIMLEHQGKDEITTEQDEVVIDEELRQTPGSIPRKRMSYVQSLSVYTGTYSRAPLWKIFSRPFIIFFYPAVFWAFLIYGTTLTWIVVFSVVNGSIFVEPPYNFTISQTGLISLSPFIFTIIGEVVSGPLNDWICVKLTKRNNGVYESEFRLVLIIPVILLGVAGFYGFGASVHYQTHWIGPVLCFGLANMSLAFANVCVYGYIIDSYEALTEEAFVAMNSRNFLTFALTFFVNDWLASSGALQVFNVLGSTFLAVCLLTIPLWVYGKRIRSRIARIEWLNKYMTDDE